MILKNLGIDVKTTIVSLTLDVENAKHDYDVVVDRKMRLKNALQI